MCSVRGGRREREREKQQSTFGGLFVVDVE
jgi:hypothetical protein